MRRFWIALFVLLACRRPAADRREADAAESPHSSAMPPSTIQRPTIQRPTPHIDASFDPPSPSVGQATILTVTLRGAHSDGSIQTFIDADRECEIADVKSAWVKGNLKDVRRVATMKEAGRFGLDVFPRAVVAMQVTMVAKKRGECSMQLRAKPFGSAETSQMNVATATLLVLE